MTKEELQKQIENRGYKTTVDYTSLQYETAVNTIVRALMIFPKALELLDGFYVYNCEEQERESFDGITHCEYNGKEKRKYIVGISIQAIDSGSEYAAFIILHELTHLFVDCPYNSHTDDFHAFLDGLINKYNKEYHTDITNDYAE